MSNRIFISILLVSIVGFTSVLTIKNKTNPTQERPGQEHADNGQQHVDQEAVSYDGVEPPTSGDHANPLPWQVYSQEVPDVNIIHNLEHGGVYISYDPELPKEELDKIKAVFFAPFNIEGFEPNKVIMAPRSTNEDTIVLSSWRRSEKFESVNIDAMIEYYRRNVGKSPEPAAS